VVTEVGLAEGAIEEVDVRVEEVDVYLLLIVVVDALDVGVEV
jgi:hypothetical protein